MRHQIEEMAKKKKEKEKEKGKEKEEEYEGLKVIGCGFGRTGTMSLKLALDLLDFSCYHGYEVIRGGFVDVPFWDSAADVKIEENEEADINFDLVFDGSRNKTKQTWDATVDWPSAFFYKELAAKYPNAKLILTIRDPEKWYNSLFNTVYWADCLSPLQKLMFHFWDFNELDDKTIWNGTFEGKFEDKSFAKKVFERHVEEVKRIIPKERLLVFQPSEGWGPLCKFLGKEVPKIEFPKGNSAEEFRQLNWGQWKKDIAKMVLVLVVFVFLLRLKLFWWWDIYVVNMAVLLYCLFLYD